MNVENVAKTKKETSSSLSQDKPRIIDRIEEISFGAYVNVVLNNFSDIVLVDDITEEECNNARSILMAEFADMVGDLDYITSIQGQFKTMRLTLKQLMLTLGQKVLTLTYDDELFNFLKKERLIPRNAEYPKTLSELNEVLATMQNEIEFINIELAETLKHDKVEKKSVEPQQPSKRTFIKLLASVSQFVKFNVTFETNCAVVAEYVARLQDYQRELESKKSKK